MSSTRRVHTLAFALFLLALVAGSWPPRWVGDGGEYLAMAMNLGDTRHPWFTDDDIARVHDEIEAANLPVWDIASSTYTAADGTHDFVHFWLYPALASPLVTLARHIGLSPLDGFTAFNALLMLAAFFVAWPRLGSTLAWLVFAGPTIWWIDKAHTELFSVGGIALGLLLLTDAPIAAMIAFGAAATQNPPIASLIGLAVVALFVARSPLIRGPRLWVGVVLGTAVAAMHAIYYEHRYGEISILLRAQRHTFPAVRAMLVAPLDPDLGLFPSFPALGVVLVLAIAVLAWRAPRRLFSPAGLTAIGASVIFLVSFAMNGNMHNAGTPGMSRYGLWFIPLTLPWLAELNAVGGGLSRALVLAAAVPSVAVSTFVFHPAQHDNYRQPTMLAHVLWTRHPNWNNPLPEVFVDSQIGRVEGDVPSATEHCEKILLVGRGSQGMWPRPCFPAVVPDSCRAPGVYCYANRTANGYRFVAEPNPMDTEFHYDPRRVWPAETEPAVRAVMNDLAWWSLDFGDRLEHSVLRNAQHVDSAKTYEAPDRLLVIVTKPEAGAMLSLRLPAAMSGAFIDPSRPGDHVIQPIAYDGPPGDLWNVAVPIGPDFVLLVLRK
jgi:hypothetical protein